MTSPSPSSASPERALLVQGWAGLAAFMALGFLLESLMAWKLPAYLGDPIRRELFRLGHSHGTLLHLLLVAAALTIGRTGVRPARAVTIALRAGALVLPVGFLLGGLWHPEGDPGHGIWLVPAGALLALFGVLGTALAVKAGAAR